MKGELKIVAAADLGGLGANEGPPVFLMWSGMRSHFSAAFSPRVVPWLAILGLLLLKPNRCRQAWWVWLPLLLLAGLVLGVANCPWPPDEESRETVQSILMALGFGWAGMLLVAPLAPWPRKLGRFGCLLLGLGLFALLGLAFAGHWGQGMFSEITAVACAVMLQFLVFALAAALSLAGWSVRRRFTNPGFLGWVLLWLIVVWLTLTIPCVAFSALGRGEALAGVLSIAGLASLGSFVVTLPFLALSAANPLYRERLRQLVLPPESTN
jgi:hypothetical protein